MRTGFDSENRELFQARWSKRIWDCLNAFISKLMGFFNQNSGFCQVVIN
jgi:hypothetical protein